MTSKLPDIPEPMTMKIRDVEKLKVIDLKDALKLRGCSAKGNKPALTARIKDANEKNLEVVCDLGKGGVENFAPTLKPSPAKFSTLLHLDHRQLPGSSHLHL